MQRDDIIAPIKKATSPKINFGFDTGKKLNAISSFKPMKSDCPIVMPAYLPSARNRKKREVTYIDLIEIGV